MDSRKETRTLEFWQFLEILPLFLSAKILWRRHIIKFQEKGVFKAKAI